MEIPIQELRDPQILPTGVQIYVMRLDLLHPTVNGNKYFKLKYNLEEMKRLGKRTLLSFGGAFSNHIAAVASQGKLDGFDTIGMIRGEELNPNSNKTLKTAEENGMQLHFVTREEYRRRNRPEYLEELKTRFNDPYIVPEGGSNLLGIKGCSEILQDVKQKFDFVCLPVGTGATMAGIAASLNKTQQVIGFAVLANATFLEEDVSKMTKEFSGREPHNAKIIHDFHFGRYGRTTTELNKFIKRFEAENNIPIEPIYTGKMFFGLFDLIKGGYFVRGEKILALHTGGLQAKAAYAINS